MDAILFFKNGCCNNILQVGLFSGFFFKQLLIKSLNSIENSFAGNVGDGESCRNLFNSQKLVQGNGDLPNTNVNIVKPNAHISDG
jgi:hypothetical protein